MRWLERTTTTIKRKKLEGEVIVHDVTNTKKLNIDDRSMGFATGKENNNPNIGAFIGNLQGKQPEKPQPEEHSEMVALGFDNQAA